MADTTKKAETVPGETAGAGKPPALTARQRLEAELKRDAIENAALQTLVDSRRVEGGDLAAKDAAASSAAYAAARSRVGAESAKFDEEMATLAKLENELAPLADNLEGYTRALCRMIKDGSRATEEFSRRGVALKETSDSVVDVANRMRGSIIRLRRIVEPRM